MGQSVQWEAKSSGDYQTIEAELKPPSSDHYPRDATREASNRMG